MFSFFKNKAQKEQQGPNALADKVAANIVTKCIRMQAKWADYMQHKTNKLSLKARKYSLALFCTLSVGCSLYLMIESFTGSSNENVIPAPIDVPAHSTQTGEEVTRSPLLITKKEFEKIERFSHYLDSLSRSTAGIKIRDSILSLRPGLMDSIRVIENLYQLQNSKK